MVVKSIRFSDKPELVLCLCYTGGNLIPNLKVSVFSSTEWLMTVLTLEETHPWL